VLTLSTATTTAPAWCLASPSARRATNQVKSAASVAASRARPRPMLWVTSRSAAATLKKITGGSST
jgi:hypothetical protein